MRPGTMASRGSSRSCIAYALLFSSIGLSSFIRGQDVPLKRLDFSGPAMATTFRRHLYAAGEEKAKRAVDAALDAASLGVAAIEPIEGVITTFPGGVAGSGSKAGSRYRFSIASTFERYCPLLRDDPAAQTLLPPDVQSVMEIIMNGRDQAAIERATRAAIVASMNHPGLLRISAGNYGGRLGKNWIHLRQVMSTP